MKKTRLISILLSVMMLIILVACNTGKVTVTLDPNGGNIDATTIIIRKGKTTNLQAPTKESKQFIGWFYSDGTKVNDNDTFTTDVTIYAKWDKYDIKFLNDDESTFELLEENVDAKIVFPSTNPKKDPDQENCYTFTKWDIDQETTITSDLVINPVFESEPILWAKTAQGVNPLKKTMYKLAYIYKDSLFAKESSVFNKDLALFAFGASLSTDNASTTSSFYSSTGFDDIYVSSSYSTTPTSSSIAYTFAHKKIKDSDVVCVTIRGKNYRLEWENNFVVGDQGNHAGFDAAAKIVYDDLTNYLANYATSTSLKVLITGYSRGGAVANTLAHQILSKAVPLDPLASFSSVEPQLLSQRPILSSNLYVYTFEAPTCINASDAQCYNNVFNIINSADIITLVPPTQYGLKRCGIDIDIYSSSVDSLLSKNGSLSKLPTFVSKQGLYANDIEFANYIITTLTSYSGANNLSTREDYYNNYQESLSYVFGLFMSAGDAGLASSLAYFSPNDAPSIMTAEGMYNHLSNLFKSMRVNYDDDKLKDAASDLVNLLSGPVLPLAMNVKDADNLKRMLTMHDPQVTYSLLVEYEK